MLPEFLICVLDWVPSKNGSKVEKEEAPTIPETHVRLGKIYRSLGAHRMALNKFYDAINATLTLPQNEAFELAERGDGRTLENRMDAESNQAMFEIAETFMDAEDYNNAIKFFDRLMRLEQLQDTDRAVVRFKQGLAHYRRARENLRKEEVMKRKPVEEQEKVDVEYDQTPRADFAKVKETYEDTERFIHKVRTFPSPIIYWLLPTSNSTKTKSQSLNYSLSQRILFQSKIDLKLGAG